MAATFTEIARSAEVSKTLVSRFYRKDPSLRISEKTRKRILQVEKDLGGLQLRTPAHILSPQLTYNIAMPMNQMFATGEVQTSLSLSALKNLEQVLGQEGFHLTVKLFDPAEGIKPFENIIVSSRYCDGLILLADVVDSALAKLLLERKLPHVSIDLAAEVHGINTVCTHALRGLEQALIHLKELGHRRIGFFGPQTNSRYPLFVASMLQQGLQVRELFSCPLPQDGRLGFRELYRQWLADARSIFVQFANGELPTALVCQNDDLALMAVDVLSAKGLRIGRDISIVGYDNIEQRGIEKAANPLLTTIDNPTDLVGRRCGEVLINQILYKQMQIVHEHIPAKLIVRGTTGPCPE